jgi:hypothetical protein
MLASFFAGIFLSCEVVLKLLAFALKTTSIGDIFVAIVYSASALLSVFGLLFVADLDKDGPLQRIIARCRARRRATATATATNGTTAKSDSASDPLLHDETSEASDVGEEEDASSGAAGICGAPCVRAFLSKAAASVALWYRQPLVLLLNPIQVAFGCCAALLGFLVSGVAIVDAFGTKSVEIVGLMSATTAATAALLQLPFAFIARYIGKPPLMLLGLTAFIALALICLCATTAQLGTWPFIVPCFLLQGIGRASYEGTNRAVYADFFQEHAPAAFSNIVIANGIASALAYFIFPHLGRVAMASIALTAAIIAVISYVVAVIVRWRCCKNTEVKTNANAPMH